MGFDPAQLDQARIDYLRHDNAFCASTISTWPPSCGLVAKVPNLRLYRDTTHGQRAMAAALAIHNTTNPTAIIAA